MKHAAHGMHHAIEYDITRRVTARDTHSGKQNHRRARHLGGYCAGAVVRGANELIARSEREHRRRGSVVRLWLLFVVVDRKQRVLLRKHQQEVLIESLKQVQRSFPSQSNPTPPNQTGYTRL